MQHGTEIGDDIQERYAQLIGDKKMQRLRDLLKELHFKKRIYSSAPIVNCSRSIFFSNFPEALRGNSSVNL